MPADNPTPDPGAFGPTGFPVALAFLAALAGAVAVTPLSAQDVLRPGDPRIHPDRVEAHLATHRFVQFRDGDSTVVGRLSRRVERVHHTASEPSILVSMQFHGDQRSGLDILYLDAATLGTFIRYLTAPTGLKILYRAGDALHATFVSRTGDRVAADTTLAEPRFGGATDLVLAALDVPPGHEVVVPDVSGAANTLAESLVVERIRLVGTENLELPGVWSGRVRRFEGVQASGNRITYWISTEAPHLIRQDFRTPEGRRFLTWELERVGPEPLSQHLPGG